MPTTKKSLGSQKTVNVDLYGHNWIVLAMLVELPACKRPFALPILVALYRDKATDAREGRPHKTPVELMCGLTSHSPT